MPEFRARAHIPERRHVSPPGRVGVPRPPSPGAQPGDQGQSALQGPGVGRGDDQEAGEKPLGSGLLPEPVERPGAVAGEAARRSSSATRKARALV